MLAALLRNTLRDAGEELSGHLPKESHEVKAAKFLSAISPETSSLFEEATGVHAQTTEYSGCVKPHVSARAAASVRKEPKATPAPPAHTREAPGPEAEFV